MSFKKAVTVDKNRTTYRIDNFEVAIDDVKELGVFVEIEIKDNCESVDDGIKQICQLAEKLELEELPEDHPVRTGYPLPLYRKHP